MGGEKSGWQMTYLNPGEVIGNFTSRRYSAAVFIPFSTRAYSIFYKASRGLDYEENDIIFGEKIHKKYNQLVEALKHSIGNELIMPPPAIHVEESTAPPASTPSAKEEYQEPLDMEDLAKWLRRKERESQNASDSSSTPSP
ncbi:MAG: hypothetical protein OEZ57_13480 [Nitrospirota bacterium]|nr:hypothetical protein [Nitrospirota bacterium]MDH5585274.1 hypothetical protein [Nitrospirota bacterium]MDH5775912.1 hypothetical protein [Nitrospirota bacterium]